jgi:hypothetical protein
MSCHVRRFVLLGLVLAACGLSRDVEPRWVAVHNTLVALGLSQVGPLRDGSLAEGKELRFAAELPAGCTTFVAIGGAGVRDIDLSIADPANAPVAHDTQHEPQAIVQACVETPGTYSFTVKMAGGSGTFLAATWNGRPTAIASSSGSAALLSSTPPAAGTCESPILLSAGTVSGTTVHGESNLEGSCGRTESKEIVYKLELRDRKRVVVDVAPRFDAVLYIRKEDCEATSAEVACNDDAPNQDRSKVDVILDPGTYFVVVDGFGSESGSYRMITTLTDIPSVSNVCRSARTLAFASPQSGTTAGSYDHANASCGGGAKGMDAPYRLDLGGRARVRVTERSDEMPPVVHLRRVCADEASEIGCADSGAVSEEATWVGVLGAGSYAVFADAKETDQHGRFTLRAETAPEAGSGVTGDTCADAIAIGVTERTVSGDTFAARDDGAARCGGAGAPDVYYRLDLLRRSRVGVRVGNEEGKHIVSLARSCGDRATEIACANRVDEVLAAGVYWVAVDGATPDSFGRFDLDVRVTDVGGQETACQAPPLLVDGRTVHGTTVGAGDRFRTSCGGREDTQSSPDRMYKLVVAARSKVRLVLVTPTWDGVLTLRRSCVDTSASASAVEVRCNNDAEDVHHARIEAPLDPGTYWVLVDGHASGNEGAFTLEYKTVR